MNDQASGVATLWAVRATFADPDRMQEAVSQLSMAGFDRADLSLPSPSLVQGTETPESGTKPADTEADARQARTLGASTAAAAMALAAAGATVATGGGALPAVAAAVIAGGAVGGGVFAIHKTANSMEQQDRNDRAATGDLVLEVHATTEAKRSRAEAILRSAGSTGIEMIP